MKLKYYMRGLGIGMLVTAILLGIATKNSGTMTDEEIKARAMELGMVEQRTLADVGEHSLSQGKEETNKEDTKSQSTEASDIEGTAGFSGEAADSDEEQSAKMPGTVSENESTDNGNSSEAEFTEQNGVAKLEIIKGDSSYSVSKKLEELGLVEDAKEYDAYLCMKNYDNKLNVGIYELHNGMTGEEIAKIITRSR